MEDELNAHAEHIDALWDQAWARDLAKDKAHAEALTAAKAEEAGSREDLEAAEGLWSLMAGAVRVIVERCAETGRPVKLGPIKVPKLEPEPEPPAERLRW